MLRTGDSTCRPLALPIHLLFSPSMPDSFTLRGKRPRVTRSPVASPSERGAVATTPEPGRDEIGHDEGAYPPKRRRRDETAGAGGAAGSASVKTLGARSTSPLPSRLASGPERPAAGSPVASSAVDRHAGPRPSPLPAGAAIDFPPSHEVAYAPLLQIHRRFPVTLDDAGIRQVDRLGNRFGTLADVGIDHVGVVKGQPGQRIAVGSTGASSCLIVCAHATTEKGEPVVGLLHLSHFTSPTEGLTALAYAMLRAGATSVPLRLVGGALSRSLEPDTWLDQAEGVLESVDEVAAALAEELGRPPEMAVVSAKLGTCETRPGDHGDDEPLLESMNLPHAISAVSTSDGVFYGGEAPGRTFFPSNDDVGVPISKLMAKGLAAA